MPNSDEVAAGPAPSTARRLANAARAVHAVANSNRTIDWVLNEKVKWISTPQERALLFGVVRHYQSLSAQVTQYLDKPLRDKDQDIFCLMLVGTYQLTTASMPAHAVINESVDAAKVLRKPWSRGLVNAVLRKVDVNLDSEPVHDQSFGHPTWMAERIKQDHPQNWQEILQANNTQAPMILRVNTQSTSVSDYEQELTASEIAWRSGESPQAIVLDEPVPSATLPGWKKGRVAVQDMGAQYAAQILHDLVSPPSATQLSGIRILDACAAPGGKLAHLHELMAADDPGQGSAACSLTAIEISPERIATTRSILQRLGHNISLQAGDAQTLEWWDGIAFDYILLDAPCTGTGTIRRHPDIKLLLQPDSVQTHAELQLKMLNNLWQTLAPGGTLLYCTCSLLEAENDKVIGCFVEQNNNHADTLPLQLPGGRQTSYGWQLLPTDPNTDGFYYALLRKR